MTSNGIIASVAVAGGSSALRVIYDHKVSDKPGAMFRIVTGAFIFGAILSLINGSAPGLALAIGLSVALASLMINAGAVTTATKSVLGK